MIKYMDEQAKHPTACRHQNTKIWEPHLAGARKCLDCDMVYNPNCEPQWFIEPPNSDILLEHYKAALEKREAELTDLQEQCDRLEKALEYYTNNVLFSSSVIRVDGRNLNEPALEALAEYRKFKNN